MGGLQCVTGFVNLFRFIQAPAPGSIIGAVRTLSGGSIPLVQTRQIPLGGTPLAAVDRTFATLCGTLTVSGGQIAPDVMLASPVAATGTSGIPSANLQSILLALLLGLPVGSSGVGGGIGDSGVGSSGAGRF